MSTQDTAAVVELIGNPRAGSRTRTLADLVTAELTRAIGHDGSVTGRPGIRLGERSVLELADTVGVTFSGDPAHAVAPVADPFGTVRRARLLVVATPTYKATYSGLLKIFLDQLNQGDLAGAVAVPVAIAGAPAHRDSVAASLRDLLVELGARVPAPAVALLEGEVADQAEHVARWVEAYAAELGSAIAPAPDAVGAQA